MVTMATDNTLSKVNQQVLEERVNSLRDQKEQIRQRLQNPGLYPDSVTPNVSLSNINEYYRPSQALQRDVGSSIASLFGDGSSNIGPNSPNTATASMSKSEADAWGNLIGMVSGLAGLPGGTSSVARGTLSGNVTDIGKGLLSMAMNTQQVNPYAQIGVQSLADVVSGKSLANTAKNAGFAALMQAFPQAQPLVAAYSIANSLANLFGFTGPESGNIGTTESSESVGQQGYYGSLADALFGEVSYSNAMMDQARAQMDAQAQENDRAYSDTSGGDYSGYGFGELGSGLSGMSESDLGSESLGGFGDIGGLW